MGVRNHHFRKMTRVSDLIDQRYIDTEDAPDTNVDYASNVPGQRFLKLPVVPNANKPTPAADNEGGIYYDANANTVFFSDGAGGSWSAIDTSAGTVTLNTAYDAGEVINIDAGGGDLELDLADSSTNKNVQIKNIVAGTVTTGLLIDTEATDALCILTNAIEITTSGVGSTIGAALNVSDAGIGTAIDIGGNTIAGTNFTVGATGNINCVGLDYETGSLVGTGNVAINTAMFQVTGASGNLSVNSGVFTVAGTDGAILGLSLTGRDANDLAIAASGTTNQALTLDAGGSGTIGIGGTSTGNITLGIDGTTSQIKLNATNVLFSAGLSFGGAVIASGGIQLNGALIAFDTDDDSGLISPSNDQIDVILGTVSEFGFEATRLDMNNNDLEECGHITFYECDSFPAGTEVFIGREDDGDLRLNCLTGKEVEIATADTVMATFDSNTLAFKQATDITTSTGALTLTPTTDVHISNGHGLVIGHTAQVTSSVLAEFQVLGAAASDIDSTAIIGRWTADAGGPNLDFAKSRHGTIGSATIVQDNDELGTMNFNADDGVNFATVCARIRGEVDDAGPAADDIGGALVFMTGSGGGADDIAEKLRINAAGNTCVASGSGLIVGGETQVATSYTAEFQVLGAGAADSTATIGAWIADATAPNLDFVKSRNGTIGSSTTVTNNDFLGNIRFYADDGTDFLTIAAAIRARVDDAAIAQSQVGGELLFYTALGDGNDDLTEALRIDADQLAEFAGRLGTVATTPDANIGFNSVYVETNPGDTDKTGMYVDLQLAETSDATPTTDSKGIIGKITLEASTDKNMSGALVGIEGHYVVETAATGTYTEMSALRTVGLVRAATLTAGHGLYIEDATVAGTLTTQHGVYIEDLTTGGSNYGIYIVGAATEAIHVEANATVLQGGVFGGSATTEDLLLQPNTADTTTGYIRLGDDGILGVCIGGTHVDAWPTKNNYLWLADTTQTPATNPTGNSGAGIFASAGELWSVDDLGNTTQQTSHDKEGNWVFNSVYGGTKTRINIEKFLERMIAKYPGEFDDIIEKE